MRSHLSIILVLFLFVLSGCQLAVAPAVEERVVFDEGSAVSQQQTVSTKPLLATKRPVPKSVPDPVFNGLMIEPVAVPEAVDRFLQQSALLPYAGDVPLSDHPRVHHYLELYRGAQRQTLVNLLQRSGRYVPKIQLILASEGVPLDLAYLAMIESGFNVRAYSWAQAAGPWQFMESTGKAYGLDNTWWHDDRLDLERSTRAAARHLKDLHDRFDGDWYLAIAAYNAGAGRVAQAIRAADSRDFWVLAKGNVLRAETVDYVPKLIAALHLISDPQIHGFADLELADVLDYETVTVDSPTDLEVIAELCGVDYQQIRSLNPSLKRWSTPPGVAGFQVRVPVGSGQLFEKGYASLPKEQRVRYHRHQVKSGDSLLLLAKRYQIPVDDIVALNQIKNPRALQVGTNLILPLREGYTSKPVETLADSYVRSRRSSYTVQRGDSLWSISRRFAVTEKQLRVWNALGWDNLLRPGQRLVVSQPTTRAVAEKTTASSQPAKKLVYKVEPGDTLWGIGRRFSVNAKQIRDWNDLSVNHVLKPGQQLTLLVSAADQG